MTKPIFRPYVLVAVVIAAATVALAAQRPAASPAVDQVVYASVLDDAKDPGHHARGSRLRGARRERGARSDGRVACNRSPCGSRRSSTRVSRWKREHRATCGRRCARISAAALQTDADIALFEFGERPTRLVDYTRDSSRLETAVDRLFARSGSGAYALDAIVDVSRDFRLRDKGGQARDPRHQRRGAGVQPALLSDRPRRAAGRRGPPCTRS